MTGTLVETKLFSPAPRAGLVARPRLDDRLSRGGRLVLVSAPAGFGKTTLLGGWLTSTNSRAAADTAVAWVSLDEGDQEASSFWTYVITALDRAVPGVGAGALPLLSAGQSSTEAVLVVVLNELSVLPGEVTLVLDDYHLADGPGIRSGMSFFVDRLPPQVRLVISTRADPGLPLARLRARGELIEVRAADLRFTRAEAAAYLNDVTGLRLTAEDVASLEERTEGWVAALQLAALSLQGRGDAAGFIAGFAGDDRFVVDYLVEEVLDRQPDAVRRFLLETSVLDRLTGPLCDAVTGEHDGKAMLERLDRANLFLVPLDDQRRWYRYHHLFGDVLRSHLLDERGDVAELHRRAGNWYGEAGEPVPAVRHALAAGDIDRAADLVELAVPELRRNRQEATLRRWIDDLPDDVVERRPVLAMGFVGALMASNEFGGIEHRLRDIERLLTGLGSDTQPGARLPEIVVVDEHEFARLPGCIEQYRAALALIGGDPAGTLEHARLAVDRAPEHDHLTRASADALAGIASWTTGDLEAAHRSYADAADGLHQVGYVSDVLGCCITLADLESTQGRLRQAQRTYEHALELAAGHEPALRGTRDMYVGLSQVALERNDLAAATEYLRRSDELGEQAGLPQNPYRWRVAMALLREAEGDRGAALGLLAEAERVYVGDFAPNVRPIPALRARMLAAHGDVAAALEWAHRYGVTVHDEVSYLREYEHVTLARVLFAKHDAEGSQQVLRDAIGLLERLLAAAEDGDRNGTVIELLVLLALAQHADGDDDEAQAMLERALALAEPEGYIRVFSSEGQPMTTLLTTLDRHRPGRAYVRQLLDAASESQGQLSEAYEAGRPEHNRAARDDLIEPLTERELDVMRLLASDLDGPSIARELVVSLNTIRTHTRNIYAKFGVNNRRAAVRRAHQLNLLSHRSAR
ncbi:LuxR family maltose regulon positive regulatory protein [Kribbella steppae]|uniref:LuxR family maltose regulon positive regulatory protein n=1 Tax=Kribbella steppae TaxID=2512223 RepID=A0A4R2GSQ5_9ACTN|nr:LuxR C-terminal-related transcriptional regulator [Kribbella steppae]TCO13147.1 LuxR family maltose regulon positive regulatory protein [Kribbella steppae]